MFAYGLIAFLAIGWALRSRRTGFRLGVDLGVLLGVMLGLRLELDAETDARGHSLLGWLADHGVLTAFQIAHALFPSLDFAQQRLRKLVALGSLVAEPMRKANIWVA